MILKWLFDCGVLKLLLFFKGKNLFFKGGKSQGPAFFFFESLYKKLLLILSKGLGFIIFQFPLKTNCPHQDYKINLEENSLKLYRMFSGKKQQKIVRLN